MMVPLSQLPFTVRLNNALVVYVIYLFKTIWPSNLGCFYPYPPYIGPLQAMSAAMVLAAISAASIFAIRKHPYLFVGWFWYLGVLFPVIGLLQAGSPRMADHFTYVPLIGVFIAVAWLLPTFLPTQAYWRKYVLPGLVGVVLILLTVTAWKQTTYWKNSVALFKHTLSVTERNDLIHTTLGAVLLTDGRLDEAIEHYQLALKDVADGIEPWHIRAHLNLGIAYSRQQSFDRAIEHYQAVIHFDPAHFTALNNLGDVLCEQGRFAEAESILRRAVSLDPASAATQCLRGFALIGLGQFDKAEQCFRTAAEINPIFTVPDEEIISRHVRAGVWLAEAGRLPQATAQFRQVLAYLPDHVGSRYGTSLDLLKTGRWDVARLQFAEAHNELGNLLLGQGDRESAIEHFRTALRLDPDLQAAREALQQFSAD